MSFLRLRENETRETRRSRAPVLARLKGERTGFRRVEDIGQGGFRVQTTLSLKVGQWLPIRLRFPDLVEEVELSARVAWKRRSGEVGLDLRFVDHDTSSFLQLLIDHQEVMSRVVSPEKPRFGRRPIR